MKTKGSKKSQQLEKGESLQFGWCDHSRSFKKAVLEQSTEGGARVS